MGKPATITYETGKVLVGDCLERLRDLPDNSVDAVVTDPPYYRVAGEAWDRQWEDRATFLDWLGKVLAECHRVLKPTGSLYVFASPQLSAHVQVVVEQRFHVLNEVVWCKPSGFHKRSSREQLRTFHAGETERLVFAEPIDPGQGDTRSSLRQYKNKDHAAAAVVYEQVRLYLDAERLRTGLSCAQVNQALGYSGMAGHWFNASQWVLPTAHNYEQLRTLFAQHVADPLPVPYDELRATYEQLRIAYENSRRHFDLGPDNPQRPSGTVWHFAADKQRTDRHPCQKPLALMRHIVATSLRPGDVVLDPFLGSGTTAVAAILEGVQWVGCELTDEYLPALGRRIEATQRDVAAQLLRAGSTG